MTAATMPRPAAVPGGAAPARCGHCEGTGRCPLVTCSVCGPLVTRPAERCTPCHGTGRRPAPLVIVGCGAAKLDHPAPASALYVGQHFRLCLRAALALADHRRVLVLSARYGLAGLGDVLAPYDLTLGQPGAIPPALVAEQALLRGLADAAPVELASARYAALCHAGWPTVTAPLAGLGIGRQRAALARIIREGYAR